MRNGLEVAGDEQGPSSKHCGGMVLGRQPG